MKKELSATQHNEILDILKIRFGNNMHRHAGIEWIEVQARLEANAEKLWSLNEMDITGGEPDVAGRDGKTGEFLFFDCSAESPKARRNVCYDHAALESRKEFKPGNSAVGMAAEMGIELLTEEQYRALQQLGKLQAFRNGVFIPQRRRILLCCPGFPGCAKGLNVIQIAKFDF